MLSGQKPVLPAKVLKTGEELHSVIEERKTELLGSNVIEKFDAQLPFLPKVSASAIHIPSSGLIRG